MSCEVLASRPPDQAIRPQRSRTTRQRKLHVGHFAFMRSVVQGLDPRESWERYFRVEGEATDQRTVRATIAWIRDEFAAAAKREDRYGTARLVRIDATRITDPSLDPLLEPPSLEAFAKARGLEDERQADQIAAYEAAFSTGHGRAAQRLRRRWHAGIKAMGEGKALRIVEWLQNLANTHQDSFLGTHSGRKVRYAALLVDALQLDRVPRAACA